MNGLDWKWHRTREDMPLSIFYDYFMEHKPDSKITLQKFEREFPKFLSQASRMPVANSKGIPVKVHLPTLIHRIHNYYDDKYGYTRNNTEPSETEVSG